MHWSESWRLALQALRANKLRAMLTTLGVIIGSGCIVLVITVALSGKRYIVGQIEGVGANLVYAELVRSGSNAQSLSLADELTLGDLEAVRRLPQIVEVGGSHDVPMTVVADGAEHSIGLVAVTEGFQRIRRLVIERGRYFDENDYAARSKVCLVTHQLAALMFPSDDPIGKTIHVRELTFTVIGVFRERVSTFGNSEIQTYSMLVPFPLAKSYAGQEFVGTLYAQTDRPEDVASATARMRELIVTRHRTGATYRVENLTSLLDAAQKISFALTVVLVVIAFIALLISGIGIMNIMLVTVTERTREIGIRKAIGARRNEILYQFLIEALMISGSGAVVGIAAGVSIPFLVRSLVPGDLALPISWVSVVLALVVSCATGMVFGYLPASRAANLHPTDSLRYE
jgi:putative ABC transport system permease protein